MSDAPKGLVLAAPKASASLTDVLAKASAEDKKAAFASLKAEMEPDPADKKEDGEGDENCKDKAKDKAKEADAGAAAEASADFKAGQKAERDRVATVFASEHVKGNEARAAKLLTSSMSANEIVGFLADEPKQSADQGDSKVMMEAITGKNANLGTTGNDGGQQQSVDHSAGWKKATAAVNARNGFKI